jgi:DNA-binding Xre family transcriptional regulator
MKKVSDINICKRFLEKFDVACAEKNLNQGELAEKIGTTKVYISQLRKATNPHIKPSIIAKLCVLSGASLTYIMLGQQEDNYSIIEALKRVEENQSGTIDKLLEAIIEVRPYVNKATFELIHEARKRGN